MIRLELGIRERLSSKVRRRGKRRARLNEVKEERQSTRKGKGTETGGRRGRGERKGLGSKHEGQEVYQSDGGEKRSERLDAGVEGGTNVVLRSFASLEASLSHHERLERKGGEKDEEEEEGRKEEEHK
eukprot:764012-Hanusia_phi.AAC.4